MRVLQMSLQRICSSWRTRRSSSRPGVALPESRRRSGSSNPPAALGLWESVLMVDLLARGRAPGTAATYYKVLKVLYAWLLDEEEIETDPMARMKPPIVPSKPVPIVPADG